MPEPRERPGITLRSTVVVAVLVMLVLSGAAWSGQTRDPISRPQPDAARVAETSCPAEAAYCGRLCAPEQLVFLPCMAVGAPAMAACREREIARCRDACAARRSTC